MLSVVLVVVVLVVVAVVVLVLVFVVLVVVLVVVVVVVAVVVEFSYVRLICSWNHFTSLINAASIVSFFSSVGIDQHARIRTGGAAVRHAFKCRVFIGP